MRCLRRRLRPCDNDGVDFVFADLDGNSVEVVGNVLELYYLFESDAERWVYEARFGVGSIPVGAFQLALLPNQPEGPQVRVTIRPGAALREFHMIDVRALVGEVDAAFRRLLAR